jgi:hypothetical protein
MMEDAVCSCRISLTLSMGAVRDREKMLAMAPAIALLKASPEALVSTESFDDDDGDETAVLVAKCRITNDDIFMGSLEEDFRLDEEWNGYIGGVKMFILSFPSSNSFHSILGRFMIMFLSELSVIHLKTVY